MNGLFKKIIEHHGFQMAIVLGGVAVTLVNAYIATKLVPLANSIQSINVRVEAIEKRNTNADSLIERFIIVEQKLTDVQRRTERIEDSIIRIENKLDNIK